MRSITLHSPLDAPLNERTLYTETPIGADEPDNIALILRSEEFRTWWDSGDVTPDVSSGGLRYSSTWFGDTDPERVSGNTWGHTVANSFMAWVKEQPEPLAEWERELLELPADVEPMPRFAIGDRVRIVSGPWHPSEGTELGGEFIVGGVTRATHPIHYAGQPTHYYTATDGNESVRGGNAGIWERDLEAVADEPETPAAPEPRFKVGDRIRANGKGGAYGTGYEDTVREVVPRGPGHVGLAIDTVGNYFLRLTVGDTALWENFADPVTELTPADFPVGTRVRVAANPTSPNAGDPYFGDRYSEHEGEVIEMRPTWSASHGADHVHVRANGYEQLVMVKDLTKLDAETPETVGFGAAQEETDHEAERVARSLGATGKQLAKLREIVTARKAAEAEAAQLRERLAAAEAAPRATPAGDPDEQIVDGADPRLRDFWAKAAQLATDNEFCSEYDRMAEAMNGTPRQTPGHLHVSYSIDLNIDELEVEVDNVNGADSDSVEIFEALLDHVYDMDRRDLAEWLRPSFSASIDDRCSDND